MKKILNTTATYAVLGLIAGVFYREFSKNVIVTQTNTLAFMHTHLLVLGMIMFLIVLLLEKNFKISDSKSFSKFYLIYNIGVVATVTMLFVRGLINVQDIILSKGLDAMISGFAGLSHIFLAFGLFFFFKCLYDIIKE